MKRRSWRNIMGLLIACSATSFALGVGTTEARSAHLRLCPRDPGGAYYGIRVKLVSCGRGEAILHHNGRRYGFHCHDVAKGTAGGFPVYRYCARNLARVSGGRLDGQSTS